MKGTIQYSIAYLTTIRHCWQLQPSPYDTVRVREHTFMTSQKVVVAQRRFCCMLRIEQLVYSTMVSYSIWSDNDCDFAVGLRCL